MTQQKEILSAFCQLASPANWPSRAVWLFENTHIWISNQANLCSCLMRISVMTDPKPVRSLWDKQWMLVIRANKVYIIISSLPYSRCLAVDRHLGCLQWTPSEAIGQLLDTSNKVDYVFIPDLIGPKAPQKVSNSNFGMSFHNQQVVSSNPCWGRVILIKNRWNINGAN